MFSWRFKSKCGRLAMARISPVFGSIRTTAPRIGFELLQAGVHFLFDDRLEAHVDGELDVQAGPRWLQAGGVSGNHQAAGIPAMFAPAIAAGEVFLHGGLHAETAGHAGFGLALIVGFLGFAGEAEQVGGQIGRGVPALDGVLEFEALEPVFVHRIAEVVGHVFRQILGDGHPFAFAGFDFLPELIAAHAKGAGQNAYGIGEVFLNDGLGGIADEDFTAQTLDAAASGLWHRARSIRFPRRLPDRRGHRLASLGSNRWFLSMNTVDTGMLLASGSSRRSTIMPRMAGSFSMRWKALRELSA